MTRPILKELHPQLSQFEVLRTVIGHPDLQMLGVVYEGAILPGEAFVRHETGKSKSKWGRSFFRSDKLTGSRKSNLLLTIAKDMSTEAEESGYGFRSRILASPITGQKVDEISITVRGEVGWHNINLAGRPIFPALGVKMSNVNFVANMVMIDQLMQKKEQLSRHLSNMKNRKAFKALKADPEQFIEANNHRFHYIPPIGISDVIVDEHGERVSQTKKVFPNEGVSLKLPEVMRVNVDLDLANTRNDPTDIVGVHLELEEVRSEINSLSKLTRPFELGLFERAYKRNPDAKNITVEGVVFDIHRFDVEDYDWTDEDLSKVEDGTYLIAQVPVSRGRWVCEPIAPPEKTRVEAEEEVKK